MKIVCDNCATKYSIADEKVSGKVFKIRCKKCSHIIVVRGGEGADKPQEAPSASARSEVTGSAEAVWHLVIDREQVGPITADEVRQKFAAGEIDVETYAWREGFADWLRLGSIDDFAELAKLAPAAAEAAPVVATPAPTPVAAAPAPAPAAAASSTKDLFAGDEGEGDLFGGVGATTVDSQAASGGMFGNGAAKSEPLAAAPEPAPAPRPKRQSSPVIAPAAAPSAATDESKMTGQRNENSMLFSLSSLQGMASSNASSSASSSSSKSSGPPPGGVDTRPGFANSQSEGSGLIDIRAMAQSTLKKKDDKEESRTDDLPSFSAPPVFSPVAAPILMPVAPQGAPKWLWPVVALGVVAVVSIVGVGVLLLTKKPDVVATNPPANNPANTPSQPIAANTPPANPSNPSNPPQNTGATNPAPENKPEGTAPAVAAKDDGKGKKDKKDKSAPAKPGSEPKAATPSAPSPAPSAPAPAPKKKGGKDDLDELLNSASPGGDKKAEKKEAADDNLPEQLEKGQIVGGMGKIKSTVYNCYLQYKVPGVAMVAVTIGKSGKVSSASVGGELAGTPTGACVERAVKSATFPPFKGPSQSVNYPFQLR